MGFLRKLRDTAKKIAGGIVNTAQTLIKNKDTIIEGANAISDSTNYTMSRLKPLFK